MDSENRVESTTKWSTSKVTDELVHSITEVTGQLNIGEKEQLDIDEVIRTLNEEYRKSKSNPEVPVGCEVLAKSNVKSVDVREDAELHAKQGVRCELESLTEYTKSIAFAEAESEELALAYTKRATLLYRLRLYDKCLADIDRALAGKCPTSVCEKLQKRKYQCFIRRRKATIKDPTKPQPDIHPLYEIVESSSAAADAENVQREWRDMCKFENARISNASSKIELAYDEKKNNKTRHIEVTEELEAGELIANQKWFVIFLNKAFEYERCSFCVTLCATLIPCPTCSKMMYCSENCRDLAYESFHRLECKIMKLFFNPALTEHIEFHAVRTLLIGTEQGAQLANLMCRMTVRDLMATNFPDARETFVDEYSTALRLNKNYSPQLARKYVPFAAKMIETLEYVGFFDGHPSFRPDTEHQKTLSEAQIFTAFLLINHTVGINRHHFKIIPVHEGCGLGNATLAIGNCTLYSCIDYACDSNVDFIFRNRETAIIANRPIKKGEKLSVSYGLSYMNYNVVRRNEYLYTNHGFTCQCVACLENWPTGDIFQQVRLEFHDHIEQDRARCELKKLIPLVADVPKFRSTPLTQILQIVRDVCAWLFTNIKRPAFEHAYIQSILYVLMSLRYDEFCQYIPADVFKDFAHGLLLGTADRVNVDVSILPEAAGKRRRRRKNKTKVEAAASGTT